VRSARDGIRALREALIAQDGKLAETLREEPVGELDEPGPPQVAASGPRCAPRALEYELLLEMILEGSRLHYGSPRLVDCPDRDLALLLGDQLYAMGLLRLARLGDLDAVAELADVISIVALAHAGSDPELAEAVWHAGAVAIGCGSSETHRAAKALARSRGSAALPAMREVALARSTDASRWSGS
jgi:hypothetical protein